MMRHIMKSQTLGIYLKSSLPKWQRCRFEKTLLSSSLTSQDLVRRLNAFNVAFDERYKKQSLWGTSSSSAATEKAMAPVRSCEKERQSPTVG
ncbi:exocyst complex component EXO70A [Spatholobus suberectus]|nr:exocyst complex component EXO70A [Spatholobus suberectus]